MKLLILCSLLAVGFLAWNPAAAEEVKLDVSWSLDEATGVHTNNQTGIAFPRTIAGFELKRATPANADGSGSFAYLGKQGLVTLSLAHRLIRGFTGSDDCTAEYRESTLETMEEIHGETDEEDRFTFSFTYRDRKITGRGVTIHTISAPQLGGSVYSEFGTVLVGDFLYSYRATFRDKAGLKELAAFVKAIGCGQRTKEKEDSAP